jgi:hypothetical protein
VGLRAVTGSARAATCGRAGTIQEPATRTPGHIRRGACRTHRPNVCASLRLRRLRGGQMKERTYNLGAGLGCDMRSSAAFPACDIQRLQPTLTAILCLVVPPCPRPKCARSLQHLWAWQHLQPPRFRQRRARAKRTGFSSARHCPSSWATKAAGTVCTGASGATSWATGGGVPASQR